jgi:hypothetical protein
MQRFSYDDIERTLRRTHVARMQLREEQLFERSCELGETSYEIVR